MQISEGKRKGLEALADDRGVIAALAIDQRGALRKLFSAATGIEPERIPREDLEKFKEAVSRILTPYASAILLDPEIGLTAASAAGKKSPDCCWLTSKPVLTNPFRDGCRVCWMAGRLKN